MQIRIDNASGRPVYQQIIDQVISTKVSQIMQRWGTNFIYGVTIPPGLSEPEISNTTSFPTAKTSSAKI